MIGNVKALILSSVCLVALAGAADAQTFSAPSVASVTASMQAGAATQMQSIGGESFAGAQATGQASYSAATPQAGAGIGGGGQSSANLGPAVGMGGGFTPNVQVTPSSGGLSGAMQNAGTQIAPVVSGGLSNAGPAISGAASQAMGGLGQFSSSPTSSGGLSSAMQNAGTQIAPVVSGGLSNAGPAITGAATQAMGGLSQFGSSPPTSSGGLSGAIQNAGTQIGPAIAGGMNNAGPAITSAAAQAMGAFGGSGGASAAASGSANAAASAALGGGGGASGGGGSAGGGSGGGGSAPAFLQANPFIVLTPWVTVDMPGAASTQGAHATQAAHPPQVIHPQLPTSPGYPTRPPTHAPAPPQNSSGTAQPVPSGVPAPSTWTPTYAYPTQAQWAMMSDAQRMIALRDAYTQSGMDPNTAMTPEGWRAYLQMVNGYYGASNPTTWPPRAQWQSMNQAQRTQMMRDMLIQLGYDPAAITSEVAQRWLYYYNVDYYYSAEYQTYLAQQSAFNAGNIQQYLDLGGSLTTVALEQIYQNGYDPFASGGSVAFGPSSAGSQQPSTVPMSLSAAGNSLSAAGNSLSLAGSMTPSSVGNTPAIDWYSLSAVGNSLALNWGGGMSLAGNSLSLAGGFNSLNGAFGSPVTLAGASGGAWGGGNSRGFQTISGQFSGFTPGAQVAGYVSGLTQAEVVNILRLNGAGGLNRLLAQPFNVVLTWGPNAYDIDLHMTGPSPSGDRFHIFYAAAGDLNNFPYAALIRDCICNSGSEVMLTTQLVQGGVYRISAFNFGDQSATSTNLSSQGQLQLQIVRGGVATPVGNGTTIQGGHVVFTGTPPTGQPGNTWVAVEIDPNTGQIRAVSQVINSQGSGNVH